MSKRTTDESTVQVSDSMPDEASVLQRILFELSALSHESRQRLIDTVCVFHGLTTPSRGSSNAQDFAPQTNSKPTSSFQFSEEEIPSVKNFIYEKSPRTDVERVACLAYYLARYRATPHIKTADITAINKESAHRAFSNTAFAVENATKTGYLVPSIKGSKQISAYGERFVEALPDRDAAKDAMTAARASRRSKSSKKRTTNQE
jgi:hypothetical protein